MLSVTLAARQQSRCLHLALGRSAATSSSTSNNNNNTLSPPALMSRSQLLKTPAFPSLASSSSSTLVPASHFSTSSSRAMSGAGSDHVKMWTLEKVVSLIQIPAFIVPLVMTNPVTDAVFCTLLVLHSHWGIEAIVVDYIRPALFGGSTTIPNIAQGLVWVLSAVTLGGLYYFNYTDVGVVNAIKMLWKL